jgi:Flp pilus assembly protein CpaB
MELEYRDDRRRGKIIVVVGVILALVAGGAAFYLLNQAQAQAGQSSVARVPAVVAVTVIPARQAIKAADVTIRQVPLDDSNANGVATDVNAVIGRVPAVTILQNQIVTTNMLSSSTEGAAFSILGPEETISPDSAPWRAVSITVADDLAVGGMLSPGQSVDVLVTAVVNPSQALVSTGQYMPDQATKVTYQDMVILARKDAFYVLRATLPVAEEILHMQATGQVTFSLALRPDLDQRAVDAGSLGETMNMIIGKYGLPIPRPLGVGPRPAGPTPFPSPSASTEPAPSDPSASASPGASAGPAVSPSAAP